MGCVFEFHNVIVNVCAKKVEFERQVIRTEILATILTIQIVDTQLFGAQTQT